MDSGEKFRKMLEAMTGETTPPPTTAIREWLDEANKLKWIEWQKKKETGK